MSIKSIIVFIVIYILIVRVDQRMRRRGGRAGTMQGVGKTLGSGVVNLLNEFRDEPVPMPKGYKR